MRIDNLQSNLLEPVKDSVKKDPVNGVPFGDFLKDAIGNVNQLHLEADDMSKKLVTGEIGDIHEVMIATEKANVALQLSIQIRNKMVEAYQEIMRMQI